MNIKSFFAPKRQQAFHQTLPEDDEQQIASGSDNFGALQQEEGQGTATRLSANALDEFARQIGPKEISPSDSVSQVCGESSVVESSAAVANRKRDCKAATKSSGVTSEVSRSSSGRFEAKYKVGEKTAGGAIIREVIEGNLQLIEKDKKGNKIYKCLKCNKQLIKGH
jgi:hypothetical protein